MLLLPAEGVYLSICVHWSCFSIASELCKWLSPLKTQVSAVSVCKLPVLWCCPWLPLPVSHGQLWCCSPSLTVSSPGNASLQLPRAQTPKCAPCHGNWKSLTWVFSLAYLYGIKLRSCHPSQLCHLHEMKFYIKVHLLLPWMLKCNSCQRKQFGLLSVSWVP